MPNSITSLLLFLQTARHSSSRSNLRMTMMASVRCFPLSHHTNASASSLILNRRHTILTTWLNFSHLNAARSALSTQSLQVTQSVEQIALLDRQIKDVESEMTEIMLGLDSTIMTIPGIEYINDGMILGEIGDIHRVSKPCQLLAFPDRLLRYTSLEISMSPTQKCLNVAPGFSGMH